MADPAVHQLTGVGIGRGAAVGPVARMAPPLPEPTAEPSRRQAAEELAVATTALAGVAAAVTLAAAGLSVWVARRALSPLQEVADRARQVSRGDLSARMPRSDDPDLAVRMGAAAARHARSFGWDASAAATADAYTAALHAHRRRVRSHHG